MKNLILSMVIPLLCGAGSVHAHEVWIEPLRWDGAHQSQIKADIFNGEEFVGNALIWDDRAVVRAETWQDGKRTDLAGRLGDRPALVAPTTQDDGVVTFVYQSSHRTVDYTDFEKFAAFVREKGHDWVIGRHEDRKLPRAPVKEAYSRFAKSLVQVGEGQGVDAFRGLELELVALADPYAVPRPEEMSVRLYYRDAVLPDTRVTVFERLPDGSVSTSVLQTDDSGETRFPVTQGATYLVDAVVLREPARDLVVETRGAVWESLWASLTFRSPDRQ